MTADYEAHMDRLTAIRSRVEQGAVGGAEDGKAQGVWVRAVIVPNQGNGTCPTCSRAVDDHTALKHWDIEEPVAKYGCPPKATQPPSDFPMEALE